MGYLTRYGNSDLFERNIKITINVLNGDTLKDTSLSYNLSAGRIPQIVSKFCRMADNGLYSKMPPCKTVNISWLRANKGLFIKILCGMLKK